MITPPKLQKGSYYKNRGIVKWNNELGSYAVGNRLNFVIPYYITDQLFSQAIESYESGGLLFFELLKSPARTLVVKEGYKLTNISKNPWNEFIPDREEVMKIISNRARKRKLFLPAFYHIHPVSYVKANIQYDFYTQAGPSQEDLASSYFTYPFLLDGKLAIPELVVCKHPLKNWLFIGYYDYIRLDAIDIQRNYLQQELGLGLINGLKPTFRSINNKLKNMDPFLLAGLLLFGYSTIKNNQPQIQSYFDNVKEIINAELNLKVMETQLATVKPVPYYSITNYGLGCIIYLPGKGHYKKISSLTSKYRVTTKFLKEVKKYIYR
jgi:hypothetical protein